MENDNEIKKFIEELETKQLISSDKETHIQIWVNDLNRSLEKLLDTLELTHLSENELRNHKLSFIWAYISTFIVTSDEEVGTVRKDIFTPNSWRKMDEQN